MSKLAEKFADQLRDRSKTQSGFLIVPLSFQEIFTNSSKFADIAFQCSTNRKIAQAHDKIAKENISPFLAWAETLDLTARDLPVLLDMDEESCVALIRNTKLSVPCSNILSFCRTVGLHPVYLQPGMGRDQPYDYHVFKVIAEIAIDQNSSPRDREIALQAMRSAKELYERKRPVGSLRMHQAILDNRKNAISTHNPYDHLTGKVDSFAADFSLELTVALDAYERKLLDNVLAHEVSLEDDYQKCDGIRNAALEIAKVLYGENNAEEYLDEVVTQLMLNEAEFNEQIYCGYNLNGTFSFSSSRWELQSPTLHPDFEIVSKTVMLCDPDDVVNEFVDLAVTYNFEMLRLIAKEETFQAKLEVAEEKLRNFRRWRQAEETEKYDLPMFCNYRLAESVLDVCSAGKHTNAILQGPDKISPLSAHLK